MGDDGWCPRERTLVGLLVAALLVLSGGPAAAQQQTTESDIQNFKPIAGPNGIVTVEGTDPLGHLQLGGGLYLDYVNEPVVEGVNDNQTAVVDTQVVADALVGIGLFDIGQLDIHVPLYFANQGQFGAADFGGVAVGNIAVSAKGRILDGESFPVGLGLQLDTYIPTDPDSPFISDDKAGAAATVLVDKRIGRTYLGGNLGFRFRPNGNLRNLEFGDTFTYRLGAEYAFVEGLLNVGAEFYGRTPLGAFFADYTESPNELLFTAKVFTGADLVVTAGAGTGLVAGVGAPELRTFVGVKYPDVDRDADGDGIMDGNDGCPKKKEDVDGFEDGDGCADADNDGDGIPDGADDCPMKEEDMNGVDDGDGCPDAEKDTDGDGVSDTGDACTEKAEDVDGYKDEDGCPDPDSDGDGVHDENDGCPNEPEDEDGYESDDGCPDTDNDGDALPDDVDDCPTKPGLKGNNGCPPEKDKASLNRDEGVIETSAPVEFQDDTATLKPSSKAVLRQVALIVRTHPDLGKIEVRAHTDNDGPADRNKKLSTKRADAVRTFLVQKGAVAADRVTAKGFGQERPLVPNSSESNRQKNERIEFMIVK